MNERTRDKIIEKIKKIESNKFLNDDIELFLINIREDAQSKRLPLLSEFGDFVAHQKRDRGIIYDMVDIFYTSMKYAPRLGTESINYYSINSTVFELLINKRIDQASNYFLKNNFNKSAQELKLHIMNIFNRVNNLYIIKDSKFISEIREILDKLQRNPPDRFLISQELFIEELVNYVTELSSSLKLKIDIKKIVLAQNNIMICLLEIVRNANFKLHDGSLSQGYITVSSNNNIYKDTPLIENLNLCFSAAVPVDKSFAIINIIQTSILVGKALPDPNLVIDWRAIDKTFGTLKPFTLFRKA